MKPLKGTTALAIGAMKDRPLARFLASLGTTVEAGSLDDLKNQDFLLDGVGLSVLEQQGWTRAKVTDIKKLIHASVSPFGSFGPNAGARGGELIASAAGGTLILTGEPDRPPTKEALDACTFHADMVAASGLLVAYFDVIRGGNGQHIDVSIQEVAFNRGVSGIVAWQFDQRKLSRVGPALNYGKVTVRCIWPLADGYCFHSLMTGKFGATANQALSDWMDEAGVDNPLRDVDWLKYNRSTLDASTRLVWETAIEAFFRTRSKQEIATEGRKRGINACVVNTPQDVLEDPHLHAREFFTEIEGMKLPARFVAVTEGSAPHTAPPPRPNTGRQGPLSGVRVLDFSWAIVGSTTTKTLGDLGAEVIKVESRSRPCLSRLDVQVKASEPGNFDDKPWFAHLNTSKKSLSLDLKSPRAREVLDPLIEWADIVVENFSPGTMEKLGLDYPELAKRNPSIIMVSGSVYGQTGPLAKEWGVDGTGGALSGRTYLTGWPDRGPVVPGAVPYGDCIVPFAMAAAATALLSHREKTGLGGHIDASMYEICVQQMREALISEQQGEPMQRQGNADRDMLRQGVVGTASENRWLAYEVADEKDDAILRSLAGDQDIEEWAAQRSAEEAAALLQRAGLAASVVKDMEDLFADETLHLRGALVDLEHPYLGNFGHIRTPIHFSDSHVEPFRAPNIGEHNKQIAMDIAGLTEEQYDDLEKGGIFK